MKNVKVLYGIIIVLVISLVTSIVINCNQTAKLKNGKEVVVKVGSSKVTADDLYDDLKENYAMNILVDKIDHMLFDTKYKTDDTEKEAIDGQISQIKTNYKSDSEFLQAIKSYYGVNSEDEFRKMLSLEYKRNLAVTDYVEDKVVTDKEIQDYYDTKVIGDVKASHILIKSNASDKDSEDEKSKKEEEAKKKAEDIIKKLNDGGDFKKLAKKYSDDEGTASDGGNLGYFNKDDNYSEDFVMTAAQLEIGKYTTEPVKTEYGYEIILKVAEKNKSKLSKVKSDIKKTLADEKLSADKTLYYTSMEKVREDGKVVFKDNVVKKQYDSYLERLLANVSSSSSTES